MQELTITKFIFDDWWTSTYVDRLTPLLPQEVEALVNYHWKELQGAAIRHSMRELKIETENEQTVECPRCTSKATVPIAASSTICEGCGEEIVMEAP